MKILYILFFSISFATAYSQQTGFEDQVSILSKEQKDSVRKEINKAIDVSDLYVSTHYKFESNLEIVYLISLLDHHFNLGKTMVDESRIMESRGNNNYVLHLYGKLAGVLPEASVIEQHLDVLKRKNFDDYVNNEVTISVWSEYAGKYPMPYNALESMKKFYDTNPLMQAKGLLAFKNLSLYQNDTAVISKVAYFKTKVSENLNKSVENLDVKDGWAYRVVSIPAYLYATEDKKIPILGWTKELKQYLKNGYGVMSGNEFAEPDPYTNIYGLWALLELKNRTDY